MSVKKSGPQPPAGTLTDEGTKLPDDPNDDVLTIAYMCGYSRGQRNAGATPTIDWEAMYEQLGERCDELEKTLARYEAHHAASALVYVEDNELTRARSHGVILTMISTTPRFFQSVALVPALKDTEPE